MSAYVDDELGVESTLALRTHLDTCADCQRAALGERRFRILLRRQPFESAPAALRARIATGVRRPLGRRIGWPWPGVAGGLGAATLGVTLWLAGPGGEVPVTAELVEAHIAYAQLEGPAEFPSSHAVELETWFRQRARLEVTVPEYSPAGIRLLGGRIAEARARRIAHFAYKKGHTLLSVFIVPEADTRAALTGARMAVPGREYFTEERRGHRTVSWRDGPVTFGLVSPLLERDERARVTLSVRPDGRAGIEIVDLEGTPRAQLEVATDGHPGLNFFDRAGRLRAAMGVMGDGHLFVFPGRR